MSLYTKGLCIDAMVPKVTLLGDAPGTLHTLGLKWVFLMLLAGSGRTLSSGGCITVDG